MKVRVLKKDLNGYLLLASDIMESLHKDEIDVGHIEAACEKMVAHLRTEERL